VLKEAIDWLDYGSERFLLITGEPGSGKTALAAWLAGAGPVPEEPAASGQLELLCASWQAVHFCVAEDQRGSLSPSRFAQALARQLADRFDDYALAVLQRVEPGFNIAQQARENWGQMIGAKIETLIVNDDAEEVYNRAVRGPLEALFNYHPSLRVLILVDALDEALTAGRSNIVTLLAGSDDLPSGVRFVLTSRNEGKVIEQFSHKRLLNISAPKYASNGDKDIRAYVERRMNEESIKVQVAAIGSLEEVSNQLVQQAAGNFLYVKFLLDDVARGRPLLTDTGRLPHGLFGLYRAYLDRLMPDMLNLGKSERWQAEYQPFLGSLSVAMPAAPPDSLAGWLSWPESRVENLRTDLTQIIEEDAAGYRLYHRSMADFLAVRDYQDNGASIHNRYYTPPHEQHERITSFYLSRWGGLEQGLPGLTSPQALRPQDSYPLRHLSTHLLLAEEYDALFNLSRNSRFSEAQTLAFPDDPGFSLTTIRDAIRGAARKDDPGTIAEFVIRHAFAMSTITRESPLDDLRKGELQRALSRAEKFEDKIELLSIWYLLLAWELKGSDRIVEPIPKAKEVLERLSQKLLSSHQRLTGWSDAVVAILMSLLYDLGEEAVISLQRRLLNDDGRRMLCNRLIEGRHFNAAFRIADDIQFSQDSVKALIVEEQAKAGEVDDAYQLAKQLIDPSLRHRVLKQIAIERVHISQIEEAIKILEEIRDSFGDRAIVLGEIAAAYARQDQMEAARKMLDSALEEANKITNPLKEMVQSRVRREIASALAEIEGFEQETSDGFRAAVILAKNIRDGVLDVRGLRVEVLCQIASAQTKAKAIQAARETFVAALREAQEINDFQSQTKHIHDIAVTQIKVGLYEAAIKTSTELRSQIYPKIQCEIAIAYAQNNGREQAARIFGDLLSSAARKQGWDRTLDCETIAVAQARAGFDEAAISTAQTIVNRATRADTLGKIAVAQLKSAKPWKALDTIILATRTEESSGDDAVSQADALQEIARKLALVKATDEARQAFESARAMAETSTDNAWIMSRISAGQTEWGFDDEAVATAQRIADPQGRTYALYNIAVTQANAANVERKQNAKAVFAKAHEVALMIKDSIQDYELQMVAAGQARNGHNQDAVRTLNDINSFWVKDETKQEIAAVLAKSGNFNEAGGTASTIESSSKQKEALAVIEVIRFEKAAEIKIPVESNGAYNAIQMISDERSKADLLSRLATAVVELNQGNEAKRFFSDALNIVRRDAAFPTFNDPVITRIAQAQAQVGLITEALEFVKRIENIPARGKALCQIALIQSERDDKEGAKATLTKVRNLVGEVRYFPESGISMLCDLAVTNSRIQEARSAQAAFSEAIRIAQAIDEPKKQAECLTDIALKQIEAGFNDHARRTANLISSRRADYVHNIAREFAVRGDRKNFEDFIILCASTLKTAYHLCASLALLSDDRERLISLVNAVEEVPFVQW